jgi:hypothetical protein
MFYNIDTSGQFHKIFFGQNLNCYWHTGLSFDCGYAAMVINYAKKVL